MSQNSWWALKYRPRSLDQILGQDYPKRIIYGALANQSKPHSWILRGPFGSGKTSLSRILGKCFICTNPNSKGESCNECYQCRLIDSERNESPNYLEVDAASYGGVEAIETLVEEARLSPIDAPRKVVALDESHMLSKQAQNRLLKPLEEGLGQAIFIFITTDPEKILETIRSRCIDVPLVPVDRVTVTNHLKMVFGAEGIPAEEEALRLIVEHTYGHIRDALKLAQQLSYAGNVTLGETRKYLSLDLEEDAAKALVICDQSWDEAIQFIENLAQQNAPNHIWDSMCKGVILAKQHSLTPSKELPNVYVKKIAERFSLRLTAASKWCLGDGRRLFIRSANDLIVAASILRNELGTNLAGDAKGPIKKNGTPRAAQLETNFNKPPALWDVEVIKQNFNLVELTGDRNQDLAPLNGINNDLDTKA